MYRTTSVMALGLFLGLAPIGALAQTQADDADTQLQTTQPMDNQTQTETLETDDQQATDTEVLETDDQQATDTEMLETDDADMATETETDVTPDTEADIATDEEMTDEADMATGEVEDVIPEQAEKEMLASSLMGASVNLADESIGTISDLIITPDYTVRGVVVGVGGFLGIGEKRVALPLEKVTIQTPEPGVVELTANMTREELEAKDAFKTAAEIRQEEEAAQAQQQQQQDMGTQTLE